jgi:putative ABC transport system permease protein
MPISAIANIRSIPGVKEVAQRSYLRGSYGEETPENMVGCIATEPAIFFRLRPLFAVDNTSLQAMGNTRAGMLATPAMLQHFALKVGDSITLRSQTLKTDGSKDWTFLIVGTLDTVKAPTTSVFAIINYAYLDEYRIENRGTAETFYVRIADPTKAVATAAAIDRVFANSSHETLTLSDQDRAEFQSKQMGDVAFFTRAIMAAVLFTLAVLTGNTLRQSLQERTPEFAVLKAVGYSDGRILRLAYAEALLLYLPPAALGLALARLVAPLAKDIESVVVSPAVVTAGLACAAMLALLGASLPALRLARSSIVASLSR